MRSFAAFPLVVTFVLGCQGESSMATRPDGAAPDGGAGLDAQTIVSPDVQPADPRYDGVVSIRLPGDPAQRPGALLATAPGAGYSLILTSTRWLDSKTPPAMASLVVGGPRSADRTNARFINNTSRFGVAIVQARPIAGGRGYGLAVGSTTELIGSRVTCLAYDASDRRVELAGQVIGVTGDSFSFTAGETIEAGAPCLAADGALVGIVTSGFAPTATAQRVAALRPWIEGMKYLSDVRNHPRSSQVAFFNLPGGSGSPRMCLDVAFGSTNAGEGVGQYPCHFDLNQRFWLDYRGDDQRPALVSEMSGLCLDIPAASTTPGTALQQFPCHGGPNQRWEITAWEGGSGVSGPLKVRPSHSIATDLCLSVNGGPSDTAGSRAEQRPCAAPGSPPAADQRWFTVANPRPGS